MFNFFKKKDKEIKEQKLIDVGLLKITIVMNDNTKYTQNYEGIRSVNDFYIVADIERFLSNRVIKGFIKLDNKKFINTVNVKEITYERFPNFK